MIPILTGLSLLPFPQAYRWAGCSRVASDDLLRRRQTREEIQDIVAFLEALSDPDFDRTVPDSVPSGLPVGGL